MDYRALGELMLMAFLGLSALTLAAGFSLRVFIMPTLRELLDRAGSDGGDAHTIRDARMDALLERTGELEAEIERMQAHRALDDRLKVPPRSGPATDDPSSSGGGGGS